MKYKYWLVCDDVSECDIKAFCRDFFTPCQRQIDFQLVIVPTGESSFHHQSLYKLTLRFNDRLVRDKMLNTTFGNKSCIGRFKSQDAE